MPGKVIKTVEVPQLVKEAGAVAAGMVTAGAAPKKAAPNQSSLKTSEEISALRRTLAGARNVEGEIKQVREEKGKSREVEEQRLMQEIARQKKAEEEAAQVDIGEVIPQGKRPRGMAPWVQKGTREGGQRRSV